MTGQKDGLSLTRLTKNIKPIINHTIKRLIVNRPFYFYMCTMRYFLKLLLIFFLISCNQSEPIIINADYYLEAGQMDDVKSKVIRYIGKLPKKGTHSNKFDKQFDDYYK